MAHLVVSRHPRSSLDDPGASPAVASSQEKQLRVQADMPICHNYVSPRIRTAVYFTASDYSTTGDREANACGILGSHTGRPREKVEQPGLGLEVRFAQVHEAGIGQQGEGLLLQPVKVEHI